MVFGPRARLALGMVGSVAAIIGVTTLLLAVLLSIFGGFAPAIMMWAFVIVLVAHVLQWLFAPYIIEAVYRVRPVHRDDPRYGWLVDVVEKLARASGLKKVPRVGIADMPIPNAFAYESPLTGPRVAVTRRLLEIAPRDEIEAVLAHEIGHIKHRDVVAMMIISIIPALMYWLGTILLRWGLVAAVLSGGGVGSRRSSASGSVILPLVGIFLIALSFVSMLIVLAFSRFREYYADYHAAKVVPNGSRKLQRALARILIDTGYLKVRGLDTRRFSQLRALLISDPEHGVRVRARYVDIDEVVEELLNSKPGLDILSSHPHPVKRLRFLEELARRS